MQRKLNQSMNNGKLINHNNCAENYRSIQTRHNIEHCINDYITCLSRKCKSFYLKFTDSQIPKINKNKTPKIEPSPLDTKRLSKHESEFNKRTPREKFNQDIIGVLD